MSLRALANCTYSDMENLVKELGQPVFRAKQIMEWVFKHYELDPERMLNLPLKLRKDLKDKLICMSSEIKELSKGDDKTIKLLIALSDDEAVEMVIIPSRERLTFCLSTQVGCPVGCRFCASGEGGLVRNLEAHEIIEQLYHGIVHSGTFPDNIVFMGIGEGLLNFDKLADALGKITEADYIGMSPRRITISTSGYVPGIYRLIELGKPFILAVSLHAVDDATRAEIIPGKLCYPIAEILQACDDYEKEIGRMVTFEYTMLAGINDSNADAEKLAKMARSHHAKINLIPYNETSKEFKRPKEIDIFNFRDILEKAGVTVMLRLEKGGKVNAACGQLRVQHIKDKK